MCVGVFSLEHPEYALILCTNRDEFLDRPTENAHFHSFGNEDREDNTSPGPILSGRDLQAGGSWFGINRSGRVALLTNITEPMQKYNTSRGYLVSSFLQSDSSHPLEDEIGKIIPKDAKFAGFNLLLLAPERQPPPTPPQHEQEHHQEPLDQDQDPDHDAHATPAPPTQIHYRSLFVTNHGGGGLLSSRPLSPDECACGGISNGIDGAGASQWPKVQHATHEFASTIPTLPPTAPESELVEHLFELLTWHPTRAITQHSDLRQTVQVLPVPITIEGSSRTTPSYYGTRLSTVLLVRRDGSVLFIERDMWQLGEVRREDGLETGMQPVKADAPTERVFRFQLETSSPKS